MLVESIIDAIGHTPVVRLHSLGDPARSCFAKLEFLNQFGMKDRVARQAILEARRAGHLQTGMPIIESSSGTMALGVALVGAALGHPVHIVTDPRIDPGTYAKLRALGCVVHVVEKMSGQGWQSARLERLDQLRGDCPDMFWVAQYSNPANPEAYVALADELLADLGTIDVLVAAVGSGGSLCGTARALRTVLPELRVAAVDAVGSVLFGQPDRPGRLQSGLGNSLIPANLDLGVINEVHWLNDHEAFAATRQLASDEQIFAGNTAGSVYRVATHLARRAPQARVVAIFADRGDRYSGTVYDDDYWQTHRLREQECRTSPVEVDIGETVYSWSWSQLNSEGAQSCQTG
jgi:cysteine synthase